MEKIRRLSYPSRPKHLTLSTHRTIHPLPSPLPTIRPSQLRLVILTEPTCSLHLLLDSTLFLSQSIEVRRLRSTKLREGRTASKL